VKPSAPCHKFVQHVKDSLVYDRDTDRQIQWPCVLGLLSQQQTVDSKYSASGRGIYMI
jgi:hypothetical protein